MIRVVLLLGQNDVGSKSPVRRAAQRTLDVAATRHRRTSPRRLLTTLSQSNPWFPPFRCRSAVAVMQIP